MCMCMVYAYVQGISRAFHWKIFDQIGPPTNGRFLYYSSAWVAAASRHVFGTTGRIVVLNASSSSASHPNRNPNPNPNPNTSSSSASRVARGAVEGAGGAVEGAGGAVEVAGIAGPAAVATPSTHVGFGALVSFFSSDKK